LKSLFWKFLIIYARSILEIVLSLDFDSGGVFAHMLKQFCQSFASILI